MPHITDRFISLKSIIFKCQTKWLAQTSPPWAACFDNKIVASMALVKYCSMLQEPKKIVYLIGQLGFGGSERQLYLLLKYLDPSIFQTHVIVFNPSPFETLDRAMKATGVQVYEMPRKHSKPHQRMYHVYSLLRKIRPSIVHSWTLHDNPYAGIMGLLAGVPIRLGSARGSILSSTFQSIPFHYRWLSLHSVSGHMVNSKAIIEELRSFGVPQKRIHLLGNCVETVPWDDMSSLDNGFFSTNQRYVGIVGNLRRVKNHFLFIEAMARVLPHYTDVTGLIIGQPVPGEPDLHDKICSRILELGIEKKIIMAGFRDDVIHIMNRLNILCLTSDSEGQPNVLLEAMSCGVPVIATRVGGIPEIIEDGVTGLLVEAGNVTELEQALRKLLSNYHFASALGRAGRLKVEEVHNCQFVSRQLQNYYLHLMSCP